MLNADSQSPLFSALFNALNYPSHQSIRNPTTKSISHPVSPKLQKYKQQTRPLLASNLNTLLSHRLPSNHPSTTTHLLPRRLPIPSHHILKSPLNASNPLLVFSLNPIILATHPCPIKNPNGPENSSSCTNIVLAFSPPSLFISSNRKICSPVNNSCHVPRHRNSEGELIRMVGVNVMVSMRLLIISPGAREVLLGSEGPRERMKPFPFWW